MNIFFLKNVLWIVRTPAFGIVENSEEDPVVANTPVNPLSGEEPSKVVHFLQFQVTIIVMIVLCILYSSDPAH